MFDRIKNIGVISTLKIEEANRVRLTNILLICTIPLHFAYLIYGIVFNSPFTIILCSTLFLISLLGFYFNQQHHYNIAKILVFSVNSFFIFISANTFNVDNSQTSFFFPLFFAYVVFYDYKTERKIMLPTMLFSILCFLACFVVPKYLFYKIELDPQGLYLANHYFHFLFSFVICILFIILIMRMNLETQEKLIAAREEAIQASNAKSIFLSNMSHELRTPLNGIIGTANLLADIADPKERERNLGMLQYSSNHMLQLVNEVLDFSKIEAGKIVLEQSPFNLMQVIQKTASLFQTQFAAKQIQFQLQLDETLNVDVLSDEVRLSQILNNLLSNALKFTEKGEVTLAVQMINDTQQAKTFHFSVSDTGIGIDTDQQQMIFESFTQAESGTTRKYGGTGLGLSISRKLVALFNSELKVESVANKGSQFFFDITFPIAKSNVSIQSISPNNIQQPKSLAGYKILIAEDNHVNAMLIQSFLKKWGIETVMSSNGIEFLEMFIADQFDLLLIDLEMPLMDGHSTIQEVRKINERIPALAFTAAVYENMEADLTQKGFNGYVSKPFQPNDMFALLEKHLKANS
jgi:signal transduction histidine kinase/ActR/RegA family two-component response regulator